MGLSESSIYKNGFSKIEKWGVGLTICIGKRTPYIVIDITESKTEICDLFEDKNNNFKFICKLQEIPVDIDGKPIKSDNNYYEIHLKPTSLGEIEIPANINFTIPR
jgi:hypothetical protein